MPFLFELKHCCTRSFDFFLPSLAASITTLAGSGSPTFADGTGSSASFNQPTSVTISSDRTFALVLELMNSRVRRVEIATGQVTTLAGSGLTAFSDGMGTMASFNQPHGLAISNGGTFALVADTDNRRIRRIEIATGLVMTLAGSAIGGITDGTGSSASFNSPTDVAISSDDAFALIADYNNHRVRRIEIKTGQVTTLAGSYSGFADGARSMAQFNHPRGIAVSSDGLFALVADQDNQRVRRVEIATGLVTTLAGSGSRGFADGAGLTALFAEPTGVAISSNGLFALVSDRNNNRVRGINLATGQVITVAGNSGSVQYADGTGSMASFSVPCGAAISSDSTFALVADTFNNRVRYARLAFVCLGGTYCTGGNAAPMPCLLGSYCPAGAKVSALCPEGFYCPDATQALPCAPTQSCPSGSILPSPSPSPSLSASTTALIVIFGLAAVGGAAWFVWRRMRVSTDETVDVTLRSEIDSNYTPLREP